MAIQLRLLEPEPPVTVPRRAPEPVRPGPSPLARPEGWVLDERTREIGRRGVEQARRALAAAVARSSAA